MLDRMHVVLEGDKELKIKIPARLHIALHAVKITEGQPIQVTVAKALESYFRSLSEERAA